MEIRKAQPEDLPVITELYRKGRDYMRLTGNMTQWSTEYPNETVVKRDIASGYSYIVEQDGAAVGVFFFITGADPEPTYAEIDGQWLDNGPYGVIHRLASSGKVRGVVDVCTIWALEQCPSLRIDTHRDNLPMQNALNRNEFTYCGVIVIEDGTERIAFQKLKSK